jgi:uncharacterized membrane protein YjjP (DUF1212 family)
MTAAETGSVDAPARGDRAAIGFVIRLGRALHSAGYPAPALEGTLVKVSARLGLVGQFFSTPTSLFAAFGVEERQHTYMVRVEPAEVNLGKLTALDQTARGVMAGAIPPAEGSARVEAIVLAPARFRRIARTLAYGLASASACRLFGGGWLEMAVVGSIGVAIGLLALLLARFSPSADRLFELLAACLAALLANAAPALGLPVSAALVTLAGVVVLLPGFSLTIAMAELAARHLASGTARLAGAFMVFIGIAFGVAVGRQISVGVFGVPLVVAPATLPAWSLWIALFTIPVAFRVLLRARPRDTIWIVLASLIGYGGSRAGAALLGAQLGAGVGALAVGVASNLYERVLKRPATVPLVPGVLLLVPGSIGFRSLALLLDQKVVGGVDAAFTTLLTATSLVAGLLLADVVLPARREPER